MKNQRVCVTAFIPNDDKALIVLRAATDNFLPGYWEQVGGSLDFGEAPSAGLMRETKEESGLNVKVIKPYYVHHYTDEEKDHIIEIAYLCEIIGSDEVALSTEHQDYQWVAYHELMVVQPMTDTMRKVIIEGFKARKL